MPAISQYVHIRSNRITRGTEQVFQSDAVGFGAFAEAFYRTFEVSYPKFHKMDNLCKLGFMAAEILLNNSSLTQKYNPYDVGVILSNKNSSLDTDLRHQELINRGPASPAVFVYSLPNIVIGEICIRHRIKGENTFFINRQYDIPQQVRYVTQLLETGILKACIGGWVELLGDEYEAFLYLVEVHEEQNSIPFTIDQIQKLYSGTP